MTKVTVCGAAGGIGQPLSLMLKLNPYIDELSLYDVVNVPGVGTDLGHIDTDTKISFHLPGDENNREMIYLKSMLVFVNNWLKVLLNFVQMQSL
ncbi:unnamed protein product [[Candida] boidinii]|nr:unnamed protein product [[Candida] boidinii]